MRPLLGDVVDSLGFGLAQVRAGFIGGGVYFADGSEILLIASVSDAVGRQWGLSPMEKGLIVSVVFIGVLLGHLLSGPIADKYGRRDIIVVNYFGLFAFSILSSWSKGMVSLCILRFFVGFFFGIGQPAWNALGAEVTPVNWRVLMMGFSMTMFVLGEIYSCLLLLGDDPQLKHIHWRRLVQLAAIPSGIEGLLALFFLHQSPSFLSVAGRKEEAMAVLDSMRHDNGLPDHPIEFFVATSASQLHPGARKNSRKLSWTTQRDAFRQLRIVFGPQYRTTTLIAITSCAVLNLVYYGTMYAFPQIFARDKDRHVTGAIELLVGACWEILGYGSAVAVGFYVSRIRCMTLYLLATITCLLMFTVGQTVGYAAIWRVGFYGIKWAVNVGFVFVYQYSVEVYPTAARTTGHAICMAFARLASVFAPLLYEALYSRTGDSAAFFYLIVVACVVNLFLMPFLTIETFGMALKDDVDEDEETQPGQATEREAEAMVVQSESEESKKTAMMPEPLGVMR